MDNSEQRPPKKRVRIAEDIAESKELSAEYPEYAYTDESEIHQIKEKRRNISREQKLKSFDEEENIEEEANFDEYQDGEIKLEPFHMKQEEQYGIINEDGFFEFKKEKSDLIKDSWLDSLESSKKLSPELLEKLKKKSEDTPPEIVVNVQKALSEVARMLNDLDETPIKALKRFKGQVQREKSAGFQIRRPSRKEKELNKKQERIIGEVDMEKFYRLTDLCDQLLTVGFSQLSLNAIYDAKRRRNIMRSYGGSSCAWLDVYELTQEQIMDKKVERSNYKEVTEARLEELDRIEEEETIMDMEAKQHGKASDEAVMRLLTEKYNQKF